VSRSSHGSGAIVFCEDLGEAASGHRGPNFDSMAGLLEEVRVDVEGDRRAGVEDAADLANVETQVDDQMAGEGMAQVVEAKPRPAVAVETGASGGAREGGADDVPLCERRAQPGSTGRRIRSADLRVPVRDVAPETRKAGVCEGRLAWRLLEAKLSDSSLLGNREAVG
jgi:hypothetical protein